MNVHPHVHNWQVLHTQIWVSSHCRTHQHQQSSLGPSCQFPWFLRMYITSHGSFALLEENTTRRGAWGFFVTASGRPFTYINISGSIWTDSPHGQCGAVWFLLRLPNLCLLFLVVVDVVVVVVIVVVSLLQCVAVFDVCCWLLPFVAWCTYHCWAFNQMNPNSDLMSDCLG